MSISETMQRWVGEWKGSTRLWLSPDEPVRESETVASVALVAGGRFLTVRYTWTEGGKPQDGLLIVGQAKQAQRITAVWVDSWHTGDEIMLFKGDPDAQPPSFIGSYPAPPGPDWHWRIVLKEVDDDAFDIVMYNIPAEGEEVLAVHASYSRS